MKVVIALVVLGALGFWGYSMLEDSTTSLDADAQGRACREQVAMGGTWTEVLDRAGDPQFWRDDLSRFDFFYTDKYRPEVRDVIAQGLEDGKYPYGFSLLYRYSDAVTFAANFDGMGNFLNIQDNAGKNEIMEEAGG